MAIINGGEVTPITLKSEYEFISRYNRHLLLQHRAKKYRYLVDRLIMYIPDAQHLLKWVRENISESMEKEIKGRVLGLIMIRLLIFILYPQRYAHKGELILFANYLIIQQYFKRLNSVYYFERGYKEPRPKTQYHIKKENLYKMSCLFFDDLYQVCSEDMLEHYHLLTTGEDGQKLEQFNDGSGIYCRSLRKGTGTADYIPRPCGKYKAMTDAEFKAKKKARRDEGYAEAIALGMDYKQATRYRDLGDAKRAEMRQAMKTDI